MTRGEQWQGVLSGSERFCVVCADNREVLPTIPDRGVDHVITDPPYEAEAHTMQRRVKRNGGKPESAPLSFDAIDEAERLSCGQSVARVCRRWALVFCQCEASQLWAATLRPLAYKRTCVWIKPDGQPQLTGDRPGQGYESIVCSHPTGRSKWNGGGRIGVFVHYRANESPRGEVRRPNEHPTTKPLSLMLELVSLFTDPGDIILDPFAGSGTTGVAALRLGRRCILIEREPKWADLARERLQAEQEGSTLQARRAGQLSLLAGVK